MKSKKIVFVLAAAMLLAACGKGGNTSSASQPASTPESSQPVAPSSSEPAPSSSDAPAPSSSEAPASSSQAPASSSDAPASSSSAPSSSSSSEAPVLTPAMTKTAVELSIKGGKAYIVVKGTAENYKAGEFKFAWGLQHNQSVDGTDTFIYGSAEPADADYKELVTIAADGTYSAEFCVSDVAGLTGGLYQIYCGAKGFYGQISGATTTIQEATGEAGKFSFEYRHDSQCNNNAAIAVGAVAPMNLTEAIVYEDEGKMWVKVGGELKDAFKGMTAADPAWNPYVNFQQVGGRWGNTRVQGDNLKWIFEDGKAYLAANIDFFAAGNNYNTHINFVANTQQNCKMAVDINETYTVGARTVQVYSNTKASTSDQNEFWGNLGFRVTNTAAATVKAVAAEGVTNVKFATAEWSDAIFNFAPTCDPVSELKVYAPDGQTVMLTWESEKTVSAIYVNDEPIQVGDHKAFFSVYEAVEYKVVFELADSTLTWTYDEDMFWGVDAAIYRADEYADAIYPSEGTSVGWKFAEGDYAMISAMPVDGYVISSVKINGVDMETQEVSSPWGGTETFYTYTFTQAGDYTVTIEASPEAATVKAVAAEGVTNVKFATAEWSDEIFNFAPTCDPASELEVAGPDGQTIMMTWESEKTVSAIYVNGEPISVGDHKAFFSVYEAIDYVVTFELADSTLTWTYDEDMFWGVDAAIYRADEYADAIYPSSGNSVGWKFEEGDYAMFAAMPVDGYVVTSMKINGVDMETQEVSSPWGGTETFYTYTFTEAGDYTVTIEVAPAVDSSVTWSLDTENVAYTEVSVYTADDVLYSDDEPTIEWVYSEGDQIVVMAIADEGYTVTGVKINGEAATATTMGGTDIGGSITAYVYTVEEAGEYTITIEVTASPFTEGGEAGPTDGTVENW